MASSSRESTRTNLAQPQAQQNAQNFYASSAHFTAPSTRTVTWDEEDELQDEMDRLGPVEQTILSALHGPNTEHTQLRMKTPWKRDLFKLFESPTSSSSAFAIHVATTTLICLSALITILETLPAFHTSPARVWFGLETALVVLFTVEYIGRALAHSESWKDLFNWMTSFFAVLDFIAILPFYIMIMIKADTTTFFRFSILRTFRLLRVFRPFRHSNSMLLTIEVMYLAVKRSKEALFALMFFVFMALVVFSTLLYFAERGSWDQTLETFVNSDGDPSQFESIPAAAWFVLVTITTVGYGEIIPRSFLGRLITVPLLMFGLILIALPSFVLGREFSNVWEGMGGSKMLRVNSLPRTNSIPNEDPEARPSNAEPTSTEEGPTQESHRLMPLARHTPAAQTPPRRPALRLPLNRMPSDSFQPDTPDFSVMGSPILRRRRPLEDSTGISNLKLAENQQVISGQIEELTQLVQLLRDEIVTLRKERP